MMFPIVNPKEIAIANFISNGNPITKHIPAAINEIESPAANMLNQKRKSNTNSNNKQQQQSTNEILKP